MNNNIYTIINSVPQNSGDFALLESVLFYLNNIDPDGKVIVYSDSPEFLDKSALKIWKNKKDLHYLPIPKFLAVVFSYLNKLFPISLHTYLLKSKWFFKSSKQAYFNDIKTSKFVISSPGGYLHDYYNNTERFFILKKISKLNSLVLLGQSIGPFWKDESRKKMLHILHNCEHMVFRESVSSSRYKHDEKISQSLCPDVAFLLHSKHQLFKPKLEPHLIQNIAISFRAWESQMETKDIINKGIEFCNYLIEEKGKTLSFLSTCQGLDNYTDDIKIAEKIKAGIVNQRKFNIISGYHSPKDLIQLYQNFDLYVGMRMHGAILSLLGGTPAINIGYEDKSLGLFRDLELSDYFVHYKSDIDDWKNVIESIEIKYKSYSSSLESKLNLSTEEIFETLNAVFK